MESVFGVIQLMIVCGSVLVLAFMILLGLPQSRMRDFLMEIIGWATAIFCGAYCLMPVDVLPEAFLGPFGLIDDGGALVGGIAAATAAWKAGRNRQLPNEASR